MIAIILTDLKWTDGSKENAREGMNADDSPLTVWMYEPDGPALEMDVDEKYTMDHFRIDVLELHNLGAVGDIILADTCLDYPLIKVTILRNDIRTAAIHRDHLGGLLRSIAAVSVDLNEI